MDIIELEKYFTDNFGYVKVEKEEESINDQFTRLIVNYELETAVKMIDNNKDLKFNRDIINECDGCSYTCNGYFKSLMTRICVNDDFINVVKLLQFLTPENMIGGTDYTYDSLCYEKCEKLIHDYTHYCKMCIYSGYINTARAIYIMFDVDNFELINCFESNKLKEIAFDIISQSQDIIPLKRRHIRF
jgi:hypothetical protein